MHTSMLFCAHFYDINVSAANMVNMVVYSMLFHQSWRWLATRHVEFPLWLSMVGSFSTWMDRTMWNLRLSCKTPGPQLKNSSLPSIIIQWIGLRENLNRKPGFLLSKKKGFPVNFPIIQVYESCISNFEG